MGKKFHFILSITIVGFLFHNCPAHAQTPWEEPPKKFKATKSSEAEQAKQAESLKLFAKGLLFEREDCLLEALQAFEKAAELDPGAIAVQKKLASLYVALDRGKDVLAACEKILSLNSKDIKTWHLYSKQLQRQGRKKDAIVALKKGLKFFDAETQGEQGQQMYYELGVLQEEAQHPLVAADCFIECGKILKQVLKDLKLEELQKRELQIRLVEIYERCGKIFLNAKRYEDSIAAYRQAQKIDSFGASRWHLHLAEVYQAQGNLHETLKTLDAYLLFQPSGIEPYEQKMKLLKGLGKTAEILPWLKQASEKDRYNVGLKMLLAKQFVDNDMANKAEDIYLELLKHGPKPEIYQNLFRIYKKSQFFGLIKVIELFNQKIEQMEGKELTVSNHAKAEVNAILLALRQDPKLTRELLQTAFNLLDNAKNLNFQTVQLLAVLADQNGQVKEAEAFYRQCLQKITPQNEALIYGGLL